MRSLVPKVRHHVLTGLLALGLSGTVLAGDVVTDAMQEAYAPYRAALFRTNSKAQAESEQAIAQARQRWQALRTRFGEQAPPAPYDRDIAFGRTLQEVADRLARADDEIRERKLAVAHETLEGVRDLMAALRQRNGVIVYSDHMNAYHAAMENTLGDAPAKIDATGGWMALAAQVGVLDYLAQRLASQAPAAHRADADFLAGVQAVASSVETLKSAVMAQDAKATREALGKLKPPYSRLFMKFG